MGGAVLLVGPFIAAIGLVSVFFVMRHRSVQTKSMYSSRRAQIERKVRAARQRTLAPTSKSPAAVQAPETFTTPGMEAKTATPTATWGPPTVGPAPAPPPMPQPVWEVGPTTPAPPPLPAPSPPIFEPAEPPPPPVAPESEWTPARIEPVAPSRPEPVIAPMPAPVETPAGAGASWSIVSEESKDVTQEAVSVSGKKRKKDRKSESAEWQLASGEAPGDASVYEVAGPSSAVAVAQYAVLVVGLVMVLIGVLVMVANAHFT